MTAGRTDTQTPRQLLEDQVTLSIEEAARVIGVSRSTAYVLVEAEGLPVRKIGRCARVHVDDLKAWMAARGLGKAAA